MENIINIIEKARFSRDKVKHEEWKELFQLHNQLIDEDKLYATPQHNTGCGSCKATVLANLYNYLNDNNFMAKNRTPKNETKATTAKNATVEKTEASKEATETQPETENSEGNSETEASKTPVLSILIAGTEAQVDNIKSSINKVEGVEIRTTHAEGTREEQLKTLLERAEGEYVVFIEPNQKVPENYAELILEAIKANPKADVLSVKSRIGQQIYLHSPEHGRPGRIRDRIVGQITLQNPIRKELIQELNFENAQPELLKIQSGLKSFQIEKPLYLK